MRLLSLVVLLLVAAGCAGGSGATRPEDAAPRIGKPTEADRRAVAALRTEAEALLAGQAELFWTAWTGGGAVDLERFYDSYEGLFTRERLAALQRVRHAETDPEAARALGFLEDWLVGELLARETAGIATRLVALEAGAEIAVDGERHDWRALEPLLAAEPDPARRRALQEAARPVLEAIAAVHAEKRERLESAARALGYESALAAAAALRQSRKETVGVLAAEVIEATGPLYAEAFGSIARQLLGEELGAIARSDVPRLFAGLSVSTRFPADARGALDATLRGLGIAADAVRIETGAPSGRPLAFAVAPPADVRLALPATARDWAPIFHEAGAALHAAHVAPGPFEFAVLGNEATAEAFAVLFENLTADPAWLREHAGMTAAEASAHAGAAAARRLYAARRHAGRLEARLAEEQAPEMAAALYGVAMERAYGFPLSDADRAWHVADADDWLFGADALRAWILAAMLEERLVAEHGLAWWREPEAGAWLRELWAGGNRASPEELARRIGGRGLDVQALVRQLRGRLGPWLPADNAG